MGFADLRFRATLLPLQPEQHNAGEAILPKPYDPTKLPLSYLEATRALRLPAHRSLSGKHEIRAWRVSASHVKARKVFHILLSRVEPRQSHLMKPQFHIISPSS